MLRCGRALPVPPSRYNVHGGVGCDGGACGGGRRQLFGQGCNEGLGRGVAQVCSSLRGDQKQSGEWVAKEEKIWGHGEEDAREGSERRHAAYRVTDCREQREWTRTQWRRS